MANNIEELINHIDDRVDTLKSLDITRFERAEMTKAMYLADLMVISTLLRGISGNSENEIE